jgi:cation diffusion facilitator family transporter
VKKLLHPEPLENALLGVGIMEVSGAVNVAVSRALFCVARRAQSVALEADAWHLMTDVWTSAGVMAALGLIWLGERFLPGRDWRWLDPVAALLVAVLILRAAWKLTNQSVRDLLDQRLPGGEELWIRRRIGQWMPRVCGFLHLRTRRSGHARFIDFHLLVPAGMTVRESHRIAEEIEKAIEGEFPFSSVTVHVEPCGELCTTVCRSGCLLPAEEQARHTLLDGPEAKPPSSPKPD